MDEAPAQRSLPRILNTLDLSLLVVGVVIGSGIFIVPAAVLKHSGGSEALALLIWLGAGVLSVMGALTYGELAALKPQAGGLYVFVRDAFGPLSAFLCGWALFTVIGSGSVATLAVAFAAYLGQFVSLGSLGSRLVAVAVIAAVAVINVRGARHSARVQNWTTAFKVGAILLMSALLLVRTTNPLSLATGSPGAEASGLQGVGVALVAVLWAYEGWQYVTFAAGETLDAQRTFPRGILLGTGAVVVLYLLANVAYVAALGPERAARSERIAAEAVASTLGTGAAKLITLAILVSVFSAANGVTLTVPRVYFAMARDRVFFARLAEVHPRLGTPAFAVVSSSVWAAVLAASGTFEQLLTYVVFTGWVFYALGAASIFYYRRRGLASPFRVPGYPWTPLAFVMSAGGIVLATVAGQPGRAAVGIGLVLLGVPIYGIWRARAGKAA